MTEPQFRAWLENKLRGIAYVTRGAKKPANLQEIGMRLAAVQRAVYLRNTPTKP